MADRNVDYADAYAKAADRNVRYADAYAKVADRNVDYADVYVKVADRYVRYADVYAKVADRNVNYADVYAKVADRNVDHADVYVKVADRYVRYADVYAKVADRNVNYADAYAKEADRNVRYADVYAKVADRYAILSNQNQLLCFVLLNKLFLSIKRHVCDLTISFYIGFVLFLSIYLTTYIWDIRYFILIRKIDFTQAILSIKKGIAELEKYKIKVTRIGYTLMPFAILGIFLMLFQKTIFNIESIVMFALIILVFISSIYYTFRYSIYAQFRRLNNEIEEKELLEKE